MATPVTRLKPDAEPAENATNPLALMREPFPANQISKLPKESKKQADERKAGQNAINNCPVCGGWHHKNAVHLDYVGHAALTDRLLDADMEWSWEPVAFAPDGLPAFDRNGGLWIKLTVAGVTRLGYGSADGKSGGDAVKEIIGDAMRNAAMRFGAALDLWHKGDLHAHDEAPEETFSAEQTAINMLRGASADAALFKQAWNGNKDGWKKILSADAYARVVAVMKEEAAKFAAPEPSVEPEPTQPATAPNGRAVVPGFTETGFGIGDDDVPF